MGIVGDVISRTKGLKVCVSYTHQLNAKTPASGTLSLLLGVINILLWGIGTIIGGLLDNKVADIIIGLLQLFVPFIGWIWAIIWGVLMIIRGL